MPANKNALIRYKTIDNCLSNHYRRWTLDDLVDACSAALRELEGINKGVSVRTVQGDIQMMRSDKLGYNAPIEVYDHKYYRYTDPDYSITNMPLSANDCEALQQAVDMLRQLEDFQQFRGMSDLVTRLQDKLALSTAGVTPIVHFDSVPRLKGIELLTPLYHHIRERHTLQVTYHSFRARDSHRYTLFPYLLKEFRNRWFLFGSQHPSMRLYNLALDRIVSVKCVPDVPYRDNPRFDPSRFFDNVIGVTKGVADSARRIRFWASAEQSQYIKTKPLHTSQRLESTNPVDGSCVFSIFVVINFELFSILMSYGPGIRVLSPPRVVDRMSGLLHEAAACYDTLPVAVPQKRTKSKKR